MLLYIDVLQRIVFIKDNMDIANILRTADT